MKRILLCIIFFASGVVFAQSLAPKGYVLAGAANIYEGKEVKEETILLLRDVTDPDKFIIKIKRNTMDSKFMDPDVDIGGWINIPLPFIVVRSVTKRHTIRYTNSDLEHDYFKMTIY